MMMIFLLLILCNGWTHVHITKIVIYSMQQSNNYQHNDNFVCNRSYVNSYHHHDFVNSLVINIVFCKFNMTKVINIVILYAIGLTSIVIKQIHNFVCNIAIVINRFIILYAIGLMLLMHLLFIFQDRVNFDIIMLAVLIVGFRIGAFLFLYVRTWLRK